MLTIFSIPKPFLGHINIIQRNAIKSWIKLDPKCEIILLGSDVGVKEICEEFHLIHIPDVKKNEFGTPLLNSAFELATEKSSNDLMCYVNSDIILTEDLIKAVSQVREKFPSFLIISQRWNLDIKETINFDNKNWLIDLKNSIAKNGNRPTGIDCFIFSRDYKHNMPSFAVGRPGWDNWFLYNANRLMIPSVDITKEVSVIHQNHAYNKDYSHFPASQNGKVEINNNLKLVGGIFNNFNPKDADLLLLNGSIIKNKRHFIFNHCYRFFGSLPRFYPCFNIWQKILVYPFLLLSILVIKIKHSLIK